MKVSIVAAIAKNGIIGIDNRLPWHLPEDLAFFKQTTLGCPVLMGRKTYESINRPLPGRLNVVLTSNTDWQPAPAKDGTPRNVIAYPTPLPSGSTTQIATATNLPNALQWLARFEQIFLIGGSNLYQQALEQNLVDELVLTEIHQNFDGDASFPQWDRERFTEVDRITNPATSERTWAFDFVKYAQVNTGL
ncbi:dihydrofolate reductase [Limnobacter parvus]|uniref:Dihydrofolate reductase n=1 Tax=Limnobacter parvus TaxID=2939690 RepID=A0ABT1XHH4_9BURK|nr:dihydrofolate reductase [Limnobacter parvus]MCR2746720.1 dihydrofolate reductase [Limnobacter parvus]